VSARDPLAALLRRLDLRPVADGVLESHTGRGDGRVFGGLLLAQALVAAGRTDVQGRPYSLHAHFLRSGRYGHPSRWEVERLRDGWAFATRAVTGVQLGQAVIRCTVAFTTQTQGLAHQATTLGPVPDPEPLPDWEDVRVAILGDAGARRTDGPLEVRECDPDDARPRAGAPARRRLWMRPRGALPDDPLLHAAMLAFASDRGLLSTAARPHGLMWGARLGASLDHALWLHAPARFDDWLLQVSESPVAADGRGLVLAGFHRRDGVRVASVAQEGLIRVAPRSREPGAG
jgi:acyl-CoA thioesterase-2